MQLLHRLIQILLYLYSTTKIFNARALDLVCVVVVRDDLCVPWSNVPVGQGRQYHCHMMGRGRYDGRLGVGHIQEYWICYLKVVLLFGPWNPPLVSGDQFLSGPGLSLRVLNVRLVYN